MSTLILLRHGESTYNAAGVFSGTIDAPLSELGKTQAMELIPQLQNLAIVRVYTSEKLRAIQTFSIIQQDLQIQETHASASLNEQDFGDLEGLSKQDVIAKFGEDKVNFWRRDALATPPNGESFADLQKRVVQFYESELVPLLKEGENILLVAHGNSLRALASYILKMKPLELRTFELENASPFILNIAIER